MQENTKILEKLVELRQKQADLLGYKNHAAYIQEVRNALLEIASDMRF